MMFVMLYNSFVDCTEVVQGNLLKCDVKFFNSITVILLCCVL